ncbi:hypothetical protein [Streptomyces cucumeris]|uniref:hypothetical protein n=1 Tax=Streptomyces cucumeris TaxID=2962890 RepID=UPI0020C92869|nr:hypothetical protein [Streptomyces sp. NEAU-Y11]MCP9209588.1 hypothetical protein [Streptomyces sp. NEAU-Y11]
MTTPTTPAADTARAESLERLRAVVVETLLDVHDQTTDPYTAGETIVVAAQQWGTGGGVINAAPAAPCPGSGGTVSRWYAPYGWAYTPATDISDPGPYTVGEHVTCRSCRADVPTARAKTTERETGRQYVAWIAQH